MSGIGHNGGPDFGIDTDDIKMSWIKLDIADFQRGIADLSYEMRGFYITILVEMYDSKGKLPNDLYLLGKRLGTTARVVKRVLEVLLGQGKIYVSGDWIRNKRCDEEREKLISEYCRRHAAAVKREGNRRKNANTIPEVSGKFAGSFPEVSPKQYQNSPELRESFDETIGNSSIKTIEQAPQIRDKKDQNSAHNLEDKKKEVRKENISFPVEAAREAPTNGRAYWAKVMAPPVEPERQKVVLHADGKLELLNGFKAEWLARFGGNEERLDLALAKAANFVQPYGLKSLEVQVSAQLAREVSEKLDRDARYQNAATQKGAPKKQSKPTRYAR
jgi:uncharacterized protein YdaU (DUF1376 family)